MSNETVTYDRISSDPRNFRSVFERQLSLADDIRRGRVEVDQGAAEAKALYGGVKALEIDLHARSFEHRLKSPLAREGSDAQQITDDRSQTEEGDFSEDSAAV